MAEKFAQKLEIQRAAPASLDYNDLAAIVSEPVFDSDSASKGSDAYTDGGVMARKEYERLRLNELRSLDGALQAAREKIAEPVWGCYNSYLEIRRLDSRTPDYESVAKRALAASPALIKKKEDRTQTDQQALNSLAATAIWEVGGAIFNSYKISTERRNYAARYNSSRQTARSAIAGLVAGRYAVSLEMEEALPGSSPVDISVNPSLANTYLNDLIELRNNSGKSLGECTLLVNLTGISATDASTQYDSHFHYLSYWPAGEARFLWYPSHALTGVATNESVDVIRKVDVSVYTDQCAATASLNLAGEPYDDIVKGWAEKHLPNDSFTGRWYTNAENLIDPAGFEITYKGDMSSFTVAKVVVEASDGSGSFRMADYDSEWRSSKKKWICNRGFNPINPGKIKVTISFPGTSYEQVMVWTR